MSDDRQDAELQRLLAENKRLARRVAELEEVMRRARDLLGVAKRDPRYADPDEILRRMQMERASGKYPGRTAGARRRRRSDDAL